MGATACGMAVGPYRLVARVRLPLDAAAALALVPRTVGVHVSDGPGATIVEVGGNDVEGMVRYLAGLATPLEVLGPPALRTAFGAYAEHLATVNRPA